MHRPHVPPSGGRRHRRKHIGGGRNQFGGPAKLSKQIVGSLQAVERQPESVVQSGILRRTGYSQPKGAFSISVAVQLPIQVREINSRHRVLWAQPEGRLVFSLGLRRAALPGIKIRQRRPVFWTVCVEFERGDKFTRSLIKALPISRRLTFIGTVQADWQPECGRREPDRTKVAQPMARPASPAQPQACPSQRSGSSGRSRPGCGAPDPH